MCWITARLYDRFMAGAENACLREWREALLRQTSGNVLEIGAGTGANLDLYSDRVARLLLTEPDKHMRQILKRKAEGHRSTEVMVSSGSAECIDAEDDSFDYVVTSLVCCSVNDLQACVLEIKRVLRTGGGFVFLEHVAAAPGSSRRSWQNRINPLWKLMMGNCHLNRETEQAIVGAGFEMEHIDRASMRKALPIVRPTIRGIARKP